MVPALSAILLAFVVMLLVLVAIPPSVVSTLEKLGIANTPPEAIVVVPKKVALLVPAVPVPTPSSAAVTNAVVAICVVLVEAEAVGAVGTPVSAGEARGAFNAMFVVLVAISAKSTSALAIVKVLVFEAVIPVRSKSSFFDAVAESLNTGAVIVGALVPAFAAMLVVFVEMLLVFVEMLLVFVAMPPRVVSTSENPGIATVP